MKAGSRNEKFICIRLRIFSGWKESKCVVECERGIQWNR